MLVVRRWNALQFKMKFDGVLESLGVHTTDDDYEHEHRDAEHEHEEMPEQSGPLKHPTVVF